MLVKLSKWYEQHQSQVTIWKISNDQHIVPATLHETTPRPSLSETLDDDDDDDYDDDDENEDVEIRDDELFSWFKH